MKFIGNTQVVGCVQFSGEHHVNHATRSLRKTLDAVAANNEATALEVMRAVEQVQDDLLRQKLLKAVHHLNLDAAELRALREEIASPLTRRA
nr:hypothetical protein [Pseudomonas sp. DP-17]